MAYVNYFDRFEFQINFTWVWYCDMLSGTLGAWGANSHFPSCCPPCWRTNCPQIEWGDWWTSNQVQYDAKKNLQKKEIRITNLMSFLDALFIFLEMQSDYCIIVVYFSWWHKITAKEQIVKHVLHKCCKWKQSSLVSVVCKIKFFIHIECPSKVGQIWNSKWDLQMAIYCIVVEGKLFPFAALISW